MIWHVYNDETGKQSEDIYCDMQAIQAILSFINDHPSRNGYSFTGDERNAV